MALFSMFKPCRAGLERFEYLRSAAVVVGERPPDVLRRLVLSIRFPMEQRESCSRTA